MATDVPALCIDSSQETRLCVYHDQDVTSWDFRGSGASRAGKRFNFGAQAE